MIRVERVRSPDSLANGWRKWNADYAVAKTDAERKRIESRYRKKDVQESLGNMFGGKCAYCESKIGVVDYGHIEHYRPKSKYPKRMFIWKNLLLACTKCNCKPFKGDRFPLSADGGPLLNPCVDEPSEHLDFIYDPATREARVVSKTVRGRVTESVLGLNRRDLLVARSEMLRKLMLICSYTDTNAEARAIVVAALRSDSPYCAFVRKYVQIL